MPMDEKRGFFRIKNSGTIKAKYGKQDVYIIDISPSSANIEAQDVELIKDGIIEIVINHFSISLNYSVLRKKEGNTIITFKLEEQINNLLGALKNIRDSHELVSSKNPQIKIQTKPPTSSLGSLENFSKLTSLYSMRLYQLLLQIAATGESLIPLPALREALGIEKFKTYSSYPAMKRQIIEPSKQEINEKTDLTFIYVEIKREGEIAALQFTILHTNEPGSL